MKTWVIVALLSVPVWSCDNGCEEHSGVCACDQVPVSAPEVQPSDEKPPQDKMPSYEREGIHADTPDSLIKQDEQLNAAAEAGKKEAGVP